MGADQNQLSPHCHHATPSTRELELHNNINLSYAALVPDRSGAEPAGTLKGRCPNHGGYKQGEGPA
jgi:hypothetical protein